jgi:hypothetical protein
MRKLTLSAALAALIGLPAANAAFAQGPGEGVGGDTHEQQQQTDPHSMNRGADENDQRTTQAVRQAIGTDEAAQAVTIITSDNVVILTGVVPSQEARQRIVSAASKTRGVSRVDDQLRVGTPPDTGARGTPQGAGAGSSSGSGARGATPPDPEDE